MGDYIPRRKDTVTASVWYLGKGRRRQKVSHRRLEQPTSLTLLTLDQIIISHINSSLSKAPWEPTSVSPKTFEEGFRYHIQLWVVSAARSVGFLSGSGHTF